MAQRNHDINWMRVRSLRDAIDAICERRGYDIIVRLEIEEIPPRMVADLWDGLRIIRTWSVQADTRWQRVTEWLIIALDEVATDLQKE